MIVNGTKTAPYKIISDSGGNRYIFFCAASKMLVCTTDSYKEASPESELELAWEKEGRLRFNKCRSCHQWVSSVMYNADTLECVDCSPWEEHPKYCPFCGTHTRSRDSYCSRCGKKLFYEGMVTAYE